MYFAFIMQVQRTSDSYEMNILKFKKLFVLKGGVFSKIKLIKSYLQCSLLLCFKTLLVIEIEIQFFIWMLAHLPNFSIEKWSTAFYVLGTSTSLPRNFLTFQKYAEIIKAHLSSTLSIPPPPVLSVCENGGLHRFVRLSLYKNVQWLYWHVHSIMFTAARYEAHSVLHFIKISGSNITQKFKWNCCCNLIFLIQDKHWYLYIQCDTCYIYAFLTHFYNSLGNKPEYSSFPSPLVMRYNCTRLQKVSIQ